MKKPRAPILRGLTVQLLAITVLPLTLLLLLIAFGSVSLHQQDMRALVGERDERAVQSAAAALASELHHRADNISNLVASLIFQTIPLPFKQRTISAWILKVDSPTWIWTDDS